MNHFNKLSTFAFLAFTLSATSACESTSPNLQPPSPDAFASLALDARKDLLQSFTMDADTLETVVGEQGTTISFSWNAELTYPDGSPVTGDVNLELIEIFDRGSMLVTGMPTNGRLPSGEPGQLISGGEHYVNATQNGESLELAGSFLLEAPPENTGTFDPAMNIFRAETEDGLPAGLEDSSVWVEDSGGSSCCTTEGSDGVLYGLTSDQFGWSNIDRWASDPRPKTFFSVEVPQGWDTTNSEVFFTDDDQENILTGLGGNGEGSPLFGFTGDVVPVGLNVQVIFVTENEGQWSYAIQSHTVVHEDTLDFTSTDDLIYTDQEGIIDAINDLP